MKVPPLFLGAAVALVGVGLQALYMRSFEQAASGGAKIDLLVAAQPLERGKEVTLDMVAVRSVPQAYVDDRAIRAADKEKILKLRASTRVPVLQTLTWTDFIATTDDQRDLSSLVQPGNRAMPIRVQYEEALQLIRPGDSVDILSVDNDGREARVLLQRVLVLAAGLETTIERSTDRKPGMRASLLTVSVSLQEAQLLGLAQSTSKLVAVVRPIGDQHIVDSPPDVGRSEIFDAAQRQSMQTAQRRPIRVGAGGLR